jgi:hypothetical protein
MRLIIAVLFLGGCSVDTSNLRLGVWTNSKSNNWQCVETSIPYSNKEC